jgi:hypothetical protein
MEANPKNREEIYEVPDQYFNFFRQKMEGLIQADYVKSEVQSLAPGLSKIEKKELYEAPVFYFESFRKKMLQRPEIRNKKIFSVAAQLNLWIEKFAAYGDKTFMKPLFAGGISIALVGIIYFTEISTCNDLDCRLATISNNEIDLWLELENEEMLYNSPEQELIDLMPNEKELEKVFFKEWQHLSGHESLI